MINLLDNTPNQPTKFRTKNWVETNDDSGGTYDSNSQIKFKTSILRSSLCEYSDVYMLLLLEQEQVMQQNDWMKEIKE